MLDWLRYSCAFLLYMYGTSKLAHLQFHLGPAVLQRPVGSLTGYELTWFYYGYSRAYACILGSTQVFGATLLLFRRTTLLGAALMLPVMANILLINIFILVNDYGPEFMATFITTSLLILVWFQRNALIGLFWSSQPSEAVGRRATHRWIRTLIVLTVGTIVGTGAFLMRR